MARITPDGVVKVHFVATIADPAAPTTTEISAGTELTPFLTAAGIDTPMEGQEVDSSNLSTAFDLSVPGTFGGSVTGEFFRDDTADDAWDALPRLTTGNLVIGRFGGSGTNGALTSGDNCEVWPVRVSSRSPLRIARNDVMRFNVNFATTSEPTLVATIA